MQELIQATLDEYGSGVNIVRVNFDKADPPQEVIDAFREVQAARQERSTLQNRADAYANQTLAAARGNAAQTLQEAEGYRAQVVNAAQGEASRFTAVLAGVRQGARGDAQAALSRDDGERARRRADVPARHAVGHGAGPRALPAAERAAPAARAGAAGPDPRRAS